MKMQRGLASVVFLLFVQSIHAQLPAGFSWVNIESDTKTMTAVRRALQDGSITAIREVGIEEGFALVMTASRENDAPTPDYDRWTIYNVALASGKSRVLVSGYGVKLLDWLGSTKSELAVTYYSCWECEAATVFTTFRFKKGVGLRARWLDKSGNANFPQPGAVIDLGDVGEPYNDDDDVEQVFAVVSQPKDAFAAGNWLHSRDSKTGKVDDDVERYFFDPTTQEDRVEKLTGVAALNWERTICTSSNSLLSISIGQGSKVCQSVLKKALAHSPGSK